MGLNKITGLLVAVTALPFAAVVTSAATYGPPYLVTDAAELAGVFATSSPIRTVITVNSNQVDVLAADEKDVPKVLEKLRELCAGPFASLYPEICDNFETGGNGEDLDLDGLDPIIWWPPEDPTPQLLTTTSTVTDEVPLDHTSTGTLAVSAPAETGSRSIEQSQGLSSADPRPDISSPPGTSASLLPTLTVPTEARGTKTYEVEVHQVPKNGPSKSMTIDITPSTADKSHLPTTFETSIRTGPDNTVSIVTYSGADRSGQTDKTIAAGSPTDGKNYSATEKTNSTGAKIGTGGGPDETISTTVTGHPSDVGNGTARNEGIGTSVTTETKSETNTVTLTTTDTVTESKKTTTTITEPGSITTTATITTDVAVTSLDCPYKTGDRDDGPGPCTVITIWHKSVVCVSSAQGPSNSEFRPVFEPTASPRSSRTRTSFAMTLPDPALKTVEETPEPATESTPVWFSAFHGCTQTVRLLNRMSDSFASTIYGETVTSTAYISCSCPNLATEYVGRPGIAVLPRTTVTVSGATTAKAVKCSASTTSTSTEYQVNHAWVRG